MTTFWQDILAATKDEQIEAVVIGEMGWDGYHEEGKEVSRKGEILSATEAHERLSYEYDRGYGAPDCHSVYVWTEKRVVFVSQYDGSTGLCSLPRNPTAEMPGMPGG